MHLIENPFLLFVFANDDSYCDGSTAAGGWNDFEGAYPDAAQAAQVGGRYDVSWSGGGKWHVVDIRSRQIVAEGECNPPAAPPVFGPPTLLQHITNEQSARILPEIVAQMTSTDPWTSGIVSFPSGMGAVLASPVPTFESLKLPPNPPHEQS